MMRRGTVRRVTRVRRWLSTAEYLFGVRGRTRVILNLFEAAGEDCESGRVWIRQLGRATKLGFSGLTREIRLLQEYGLIESKTVAHTRFITLNKEHMLCQPLSELIRACEEHDRILEEQQRSHEERADAQLQVLLGEDGQDLVNREVKILK